MHLWNYKVLAQKLKLGEISEDQKLQYFLATAALESLINRYSQYLNTGHSITDVIKSSLFSLLGLIGIFILYLKNKRGDGKDFFGRYFCLYLPSFVRTAVSYIVLGGAIGAFLSLILSPDSTKALMNSTSWSICTSLFLIICPNVLIYQSLDQISNGK